MDTSYLAQQVTTIIGQLHGLFDDIGVPSHERDSREAEVCATTHLYLPWLTVSSSSLRCPKPSTASCAMSPTRNTR
jgi:hypothetical protein